MNDFTVGAANDSEIDALANLMRETIAAIPYYNDQAKQAEFAKYGSEAIRSRAASDPHALLVARDDAGLIGFCVSRFDDATIWLDWFGTAARARRRGVGAALLNALAATLPARGAHKIWCDCRTDNVESISALERAGFQRIATLANHWYNQDYYLWECFPTR